MSGAPKGTWGDRDALLVISSFVGLVIVGVLLAGTGAARPEVPAAPAIAHLELSSGGVLRRPGGSLAWEEAPGGAELGERDAVYVPPGGLASISFASGASFDLGERSLIVVELPREADAALELVRGSIEALAGRGTSSIRGSDGVALLEAGARGHFVARAAPGGAWAEVNAGAARVNGERLEAPHHPVQLVSPTAGERVHLAGSTAQVVLRWSAAAPAGARVQLAREPAFAELLEDAPAEGDAREVTLAAPGSYYWRLAFEGRALSETRRVVALEDRPPALYAPAPGELVLAPPGKDLLFWWTAVEGMSRYRVEVEADGSPGTPAFTRDVEGTVLWADPGLPEGVYRWRVRALDRPGPPSAPGTFRLIYQGVPGAPELLDPTLEVGDGQAR